MTRRPASPALLTPALLAFDIVLRFEDEAHTQGGEPKESMRVTRKTTE